ncbi:MAG TPA: rhodanese-like domain-containing protein [Steroidobacteraceae bacterium]|nr:rhodanese-like domain-containing protein [Steroidobacteraceae bacterium]
MVGAITPAELLERRRRGDRLVLLDVREAWETALAPVPGEHLWIPMGRIADRVGELDAAAATVVICHSGGRSLAVAHFLERHGFATVLNLTGGIDAWSVTVDPSIPRY